MIINFFGCSFTEGGGLDNIEYYNFKTNSNLEDYTLKNTHFLKKFKEKYRYSNVVGELIGCKTRNFAIGCNSNENILNKLFEIVNSNETKKGDIFIVQTTIFSRRHIWYEPTETFYSVNTLEMSGWPYQNKEEMKKLNELYNLYFSYSHNEQYEMDKLLMYIDLFNAYCKEKGLKLFWMPWADLVIGDNNTKKNFYSKFIEKNFILFNELSMGSFINSNELRIKDELKTLLDNHKTVDGHKIVAERIVEFLKQKKIV